MNKFLLVIAVLLITRAAHAYEWGSQWAWYQDTLKIEWQGAPSLADMKVAVLVRSYAGIEKRLSFKYINKPEQLITIDQYSNLFYCAALVTVTLELSGGEPSTAKMERPEAYGPVDPERCREERREI